MLNHTAQALAVARDTGWNIDDLALENGWSGVGIGPVGQSRDSGTLERSNFECVIRELGRDHAGAFEVVGFGHWGVGWIEEIAYDTGNAGIVELVESIRAALADYPVFDDSHFSDLEYVEAIDALQDTWHVPADRAGDVFSALGDAGCDTSPDGMRDAHVRAAIAECGMDPDDPYEPLDTGYTLTADTDGYWLREHRTGELCGPYDTRDAAIADR